MKPTHAVATAVVHANRHARRQNRRNRAVAVEIRESLPKTMIGKLSRKELVAEERARYEAARMAS